MRVKIRGRRERVRGKRGRKRWGGGERERERIDVCTQKVTWRYQKVAMYKSRREASKCNQSCQHLDLGLLASRAVRKWISVKTPSLWYLFCNPNKWFLLVIITYATQTLSQLTKSIQWIIQELLFLEEVCPEPPDMLHSGLAALYTSVHNFNHPHSHTRASLCPFLFLVFCVLHFSELPSPVAFPEKVFCVVIFFF